MRGIKISDNMSLGMLNNGDGNINPGEVIQLDVMVQNMSKMDLKAVTMTGVCGRTRSR